MSEADEETQVNFPLYRDEVNPPTERIPTYGTKSPQPEPPRPLPPPPVVWGSVPLENSLGLVDPALDRRRGGIAALALAMLLLGAFLGYLGFSYTALRQLEGMQPEAKISTRTATATATTRVTATATKTSTKTISPKPSEATATETKKIRVPGGTKTVKKPSTPQSCLAAIHAAEQYLALTRNGSNKHRNGRHNRLLSEARGSFWYWSDQCRNSRR